MNPPTSDDADLDRLLSEHLDAEVEGITAGPALLDRIKADSAVASKPGRFRRPSARWVWPIAAAAATVLVVLFISQDSDDDTDVATAENIETPEAEVLLSGDAGGERWSVAEYLEDDPRFVEVPSTCLRFQPPIEEGPFFCGTEEELVGTYGRLVLRRGSRFNDHAVFAGVFAPRVSQVTLRVNGEEVVVEPTPWPGRGLGIAVVMLAVASDVEYGADLTDADGNVLSAGDTSSDDGRRTEAESQRSGEPSQPSG
jgi:hypothetical protein